MAAFEEWLLLPLLGCACCAALNPPPLIIINMWSFMWDNPQKLLRSPDKHGVICHELNPELLFYSTHGVIPITHTYTLAAKKSQVWRGLVCGGRQEALFLHSVWKYDLFFILKMSWLWGEADNTFWYCRGVGCKICQKVTMCGPELSSKVGIKWCDGQKIGWELKRPWALSKHHGTADRQPVELSSQVHRQKALCGRPLLKARTDKRCSHHFHSSLWSADASISL